jgi:hypothetical protein
MLYVPAVPLARPVNSRPLGYEGPVNVTLDDESHPSPHESIMWNLIQPGVTASNVGAAVGDTVGDEVGELVRARTQVLVLDLQNTCAEPERLEHTLSLGFSGSAS